LVEQFNATKHLKGFNAVGCRLCDFICAVMGFYGRTILGLALAGWFGGGFLDWALVCVGA
jgi:hypothetical protein